MSSTKINVAVAGVTNGLGHAIATALISNPSVTVTLLTRPSSSSEVLQPLIDQGAVIRRVDYTSVESVTEALQGIHTIISTLFTPEDTTPSDNLLEGAKAAGVKRFAPSEFALEKGANSTIEAYNWKSYHCERLKDSGLEYTVFRNGLFMDYFAAGSSYKGPLRIGACVVDVKERKAEIPGTGNENVTFTALTDIGKFVSAAVTLNEWPEELGMSGETLSYNDVVQKAEAVVGEKFKVTYLSEEDLKKRRAEAIEKKDWFGKFFSELFMAFFKGEGEIKDPHLNNMTDVQPIKVTEFLQKYWGKA